MCGYDLPRGVQHYHRASTLDSSSAREVGFSTNDLVDFALICRAVDNQIYVAMCSPARHPEASYQAVSYSVPNVSTS